MVSASCSFKLEYVHVLKTILEILLFKKYLGTIFEQILLYSITMVTILCYNGYYFGTHRCCVCCRCCVRPQAEDSDVMEDNCCQCNVAALEMLLGMPDVELIYVTYHVDVSVI